MKKWYEQGSMHRADGPAIFLDPKKMRYLETCPLDVLPLYMNTEYDFIVRERFKEEAQRNEKP